jgi:hypothetical protein
MTITISQQKKNIHGGYRPATYCAEGSGGAMNQPSIKILKPENILKANKEKLSSLSALTEKNDQITKQFCDNSQKIENSDHAK